MAEDIKAKVFEQAFQRVQDEHEPEYSQLVRVLFDTRTRLKEIQKMALLAAMAAIEEL